MYKDTAAFGDQQDLRGKRNAPLMPLNTNVKITKKLLPKYCPMVTIFFTYLHIA